MNLIEKLAVKISGVTTVLTLLLAAFMSPPAHAAGAVVNHQLNFEPGTIVVRKNERALYLILDAETAIRYKVAVPKQGQSWSGSARIDGKHVRPAWAPPAVVKRDVPGIPDYIPGGAPNNPMGAAALTLDRDELAIHGVAANKVNSIGTAASYGCIRMYNEDIVDLFERVEVGTLVVMINQ
jgi:lipoprotein-anchoring transpeptidase ErfK/SrfK